MGSFERDIQRKGTRSSASSMSGISLPMQVHSTPRGLDSSSLLSNSVSSMNSERTSMEPLLESQGTTPALSFGAREPQRDANFTEEYGNKLKLAISEMARVLGFDITGGSCHPCAEKWTVLYVTPDGKSLVTRMRKDSDDDDEEDDSHDSDSEDDEPMERTDLDRDYHLLKQSIVTLVEEFEIPKLLAPESESKEFSNLTSNIQRKETPPRQASHNLERQPSSVSLNPYHKQSQLTAMITSHRPAVPERQRYTSHSQNTTPEPPASRKSVLTTMLEAAQAQCSARAEYSAAHMYHETLARLHRLSSPSLRADGYGPLLKIFSRGARDSIKMSTSAIEEFDAWFVWLSTSQERHDRGVEDMMGGMRELRDKMWYITDVRNSAAYEEAKNIAVALKMMAFPKSALSGKTPAPARPRGITKSASGNNFLLKTETQIVDLIAAPTEQGGPNKLADDQVEVTLKWLNSYGIENFCKGEERIHRFCLEINKCVKKLVGENILDGPVLWSSELYIRDQRCLERLEQSRGRGKGEMLLTTLTGVGGLGGSGACDEEYEVDSGRTGSRGMDFGPRSSGSDLRSMSARNRSQQSFDSGRWSTARGSGTTIDIMDQPDHFGMPSPILTIDSSKTFWSPFLSQAQSQSPSSGGTGSMRPRTSSSMTESIMPNRPDSLNVDKRRFLSELKQSLTGLLLSDLGTQVFSKGSETDAWFSGNIGPVNIGEECFLRKEQQEEALRRKKKALAKKRSMKNLQSARSQQNTNTGPLNTLGKAEKSQLAAPVATLEHAAPDFHSAEENNSSSSDATAKSKSSVPSLAQQAGLYEFPYNTAFRRLLHKFSTHPNPFVKLNALFELEGLIIASLQSKTGRSYGNRRDTLPTIPSSPVMDAIIDPTAPAANSGPTSKSRPKNIEESMANVEERRSNTLAGTGAVTSPYLGGTRTPTSAMSKIAPSTDMIVDVLQDLFRTEGIRPKTLFRDLQFIASFVPSQTLDRTDKGKAFWDTGLAALGLKQEVCRMMVEIADEIVAYHTRKRDKSTSHAGGSASKGGEAEKPAPLDKESAYLEQFTMTHAAQMWTVTAKEGDPTAERELAIFYLTNPELAPKVTQPLSRPRDTFKADMMRQRNAAEDPFGKRDPANMCLAYHWMELSSQGGDELAKKYLRSREEGW
jgi:hypothetical protein